MKSDMFTQFKRLFVAFFLLSVVQMTYAESRNALVVHLKNGTTTAFLLEDQPRATFADGCLKVVSSSLSMEFPREDVLRFTYDWRNAGGVSVLSPDAFSGVMKGNVFCLSGLNADATVRLFSVDGRLLHEVSTDKQGKVNIPLDACPSGVYVLQTKGIIHKFTKP